MGYEKLLPLFGDELEYRIDQIFRPLCKEVSIQESIELREGITRYLRLVKDALQQNEFIDLNSAEKVADVLFTLLNSYEKLPAKYKSLVVGAIEYFIRSQDAEPDLMNITGFDDDVAVLNYVLKQLGREDLKVNL